MTTQIKYLFSAAFLLSSACSDQNQSGQAIVLGESSARDSVLSDNVFSRKISSNGDSTLIKLTESKNEEDLPGNDYLTKQLKPVRLNFKGLNSIRDWTSVDKRKLEMTPDNGVAEFYYLNGKLQKIIARYPHAKRLTEYYLLDGQLSFVLEKSVESLGLSAQEKEELVTDKNYFIKTTLVHKIHSMDCGAPFADDYLKEEEKRILTNFRNIVGRLKK